MSSMVISAADGTHTNVERKKRTKDWRKIFSDYFKGITIKQ